LDVNRRRPGAVVLSVAVCFALERARSSREAMKDEDFRREVSATAQ
jgi:hypothetical protein